ncbi:MAG: quinone-interacting membrane-bound oxidoreductase complex subunit QmoC [Candidatus Kryptoniota bacterium]
METIEDNNLSLKRDCVSVDRSFINYLRKHGGDKFKKCFQCGTCCVVCSLSPQDEPFPRREMILANWGQKKKLISDPNVWLCHGCTDCNLYCPRGAKPADLLSALRSYVVESFSFPQFMGRGLKNPKYLWLFILAPVLIFFLIPFLHLGENLSQLTVAPAVYNMAFPEQILEFLFITGNVLIFSFAGFSLFRYWQALGSENTEPPLRSFFSAFVLTIRDLVTHRNFRVCSSTSSRYWGHLLVFYGFIGAMATAGLALISETILKMQIPLPLLSPVKILGDISGALMLIGSTIIIIKRVRTKGELGSSTYDDWLLIFLILFVALTGLLTETMRIIAAPLVAYITYFLHLVLVFCLLWYAPYSKLGHIFYRTLALTWLNMHRSVDTEFIRTPEPVRSFADFIL